MPLLEIFKSKPKWQHSDPNVRLAAVQTISADEQTLLSTIARGDADPRVRRIALRRVRDTETLIQAARGDTEVSVRDEARHALLAFLAGEAGAEAVQGALPLITDPKDLVTLAKGAKLPCVRQAALAQLGEARSLAVVAREAEDAELRLAALARVTDPALRASIAQNSDHRDVALAALETLSERGALKAIAARARSKAVARRAKTLLEAQSSGPEPLSAVERHTRLAQICRNLENLIHSKDWDHMSGEVGVAETAWNEIAPCSGDEALTERYESALRAAHAGLAHLEQEHAAHARADAARREALAAREALVAEVGALEGEGIPARLVELEAAWAALPVSHEPEIAALTERFSAGAAAYRARVAAGIQDVERATRREALVAEAEVLTASDDLGAARTRLAAIEKELAVLAPAAADELTARFQAARTRHAEREAAELAARLESEKQNLARVTALAERLEAFVASENVNLNNLSRALREAGAYLATPPALPSRRDREAFLARLEAARKALYPRVQEQREDEEWKRWANISVQEELCARVEGLATLDDLDEVTRLVKEIDAQWKTAREVPRELGEALRERFRKAREEVSTRLAAHFEQLSAERAENLQKKEALCLAAEGLAESNDWAKTAEALRQLQADWKAIGAVPRDRTEVVWQRFRAACDRFFTRFKAHRQERTGEWSENLKQKEALCERAEALSTSSEWDKVAAELRQLQADWKAIGAVKHNKADAIWQRFRAANDAFFERHKRRDEISAAASLAEREALVARLEALLPAEGASAEATPEGLADEVLGCQAAWRRAARVPDEAGRPLAERFESAGLRLVELFPAAFAGTELDPSAALKKMERLCVRVEALLAQCEPVAGGAAPADDASSLADRLRNALAANAMGGQAEREGRWHAAKEEVESARSAWRRFGPAPAEPVATLTTRFNAACDRFFALKPRAARDDRRRAAAR